MNHCLRANVDADLNMASAVDIVCVCVCVSQLASACACVCAFVRTHSPCLFSVQQNLINSAGMEIISAWSAQETERDGEEDAWKGGVVGWRATMNTHISSFFFAENHPVSGNHFQINSIIN